MMKKILSVSLLTLGAILLAAAEPLYTAHTPPWQGVWIWAPPAHTPPALEVDLRRWVERRPGGCEQSLVNRILGNAAIMGVRRVVWQADDGAGHALYPANAGLPVLRYPNWGLDFGAFDYPAEAARIAARLNMEFYLSASPKFFADARKRYPKLTVVPRELAPVTGLSEILVSGQSRYFPKPEVTFRKRFTVKEKPQYADLCVAANDFYRLFLDGRTVGSSSDFSRAATYDVASLLKPGQHEIVIRAVPKVMAGVLVNFRWGKKGHEETLVTDSSWECRLTPDSPWLKSVPSGFEGAGARFRLKEPWGYRTPGTPLLPDDPKDPHSPQPCDTFEKLNGNWRLAGKRPPEIKNGELVFDSGAATGQAFYTFPAQKGGVLEIEFDFTAEAPVTAVNLAVLPAGVKHLDHDRSLIWLGWDNANGELTTFAGSWKCASPYTLRQKHHLKLRLNLSGPRAGTLDVNVDGEEYENYSLPFRNRHKGDYTAGSLVLAGRTSKSCGTALKIDNLSVRNVRK